MYISLSLRLDEESTKPKANPKNNNKKRLGSEITSLRIKRRRVSLSIQQLETSSAQQAEAAETESFSNMMRLLKNSNTDRKNANKKKAELAELDNIIAQKCKMAKNY